MLSSHFSLFRKGRVKFPLQITHKGVTSQKSHEDTFIQVASLVHTGELNTTLGGAAGVRTVQERLLVWECTTTTTTHSMGHVSQDWQEWRQREKEEGGGAQLLLLSHWHGGVFLPYIRWVPAPLLV